MIAAAFLLVFCIGILVGLLYAAHNSPAAVTARAARRKHAADEVAAREANALFDARFREALNAGHPPIAAQVIAEQRVMVGAR